MSKPKHSIVLGRILHSLVRASVVLCAFAALALPVRGYAETYGSGPYGTCPYQSDCASTVVTLPPPTSGSTAPALQVNINLKNGQEISIRSGYTIIVTPLNGTGDSFQEVEFYVNNALIQTQAPDEEGTVSWFWNVAQHTGKNVKIVVIGQNGQSVSQSFTVDLVDYPIAQDDVVSAAPASASVFQQIVSAPKEVARSIGHAVIKLPKQVKYTLPYFLFLLLGADILLLLYRTRHEIAESRRLQSLLSRERQNGELKHTFTQLISHYLRTPLSIIVGSLDLVVVQQDALSTVVSGARNYTTRLNAAIDLLLKQLAEDGGSTNPKETQTFIGPVWRQLGLYIPIGLTGFVAFCFDYLARHSKDFSIGQINTIIQIVIFGSLSFLVYQVFRHNRLKSQERVEIAHVLEAEKTFNSERDRVISYSATQIRQLVDELAAQVTQLPVSDGQKLAMTGVKQLEDTVGKLMIADRLRGSQAVEPYAYVNLEDIIRQASHELESRVTAKGLQLEVLNHVALPTQNAELLTIVLYTILDNAIAYSKQGGVIEIDAKLTDTSIAISISDQGSGIPSEKKFLLFQAFSKTEGAETFDHEGMGFSLYLDKLIMNYLVGDISVESETNKGTKVVLTLPRPIG